MVDVVCSRRYPVDSPITLLDATAHQWVAGRCVRFRAKRALTQHHRMTESDPEQTLATVTRFTIAAPLVVHGTITGSARASAYSILLGDGRTRASHAADRI